MTPNSNNGLPNAACDVLTLFFSSTLFAQLLPIVKSVVWLKPDSQAIDSVYIGNYLVHDLEAMDMRKNTMAYARSRVGVLSNELKNEPKRRHHYL